MVICFAFSRAYELQILFTFCYQEQNWHHQSGVDDNSCWSTEIQGVHTVFNYNLHTYYMFFDNFSSFYFWEFIDKLFIRSLEHMQKQNKIETLLLQTGIFN